MTPEEQQRTAERDLREEQELAARLGLVAQEDEFFDVIEEETANRVMFLNLVNQIRQILPQLSRQERDYLITILRS